LHRAAILATEFNVIALPVLRIANRGSPRALYSVGTRCSRINVTLLIQRVLQDTHAPIKPRFSALPHRARGSLYSLLAAIAWEADDLLAGDHPRYLLEPSAGARSAGSIRIVAGTTDARPIRRTPLMRPCSQRICTRRCVIPSFSAASAVEISFLAYGNVRESEQVVKPLHDETARWRALGDQRPPSSNFAQQIQRVVQLIEAPRLRAPQDERRHAVKRGPERWRRGVQGKETNNSS